MSKSIHCLLLLMVLVIPTGCGTIQGASSGFGQDIQSMSDPDQNGWDSLEKVDAWIQNNLW